MTKTKSAVLVVGLSLCLTVSYEARAQELQVLFWDPAKNLVSLGVDTTDVSQITQMIDSSDTYFGKSAALFLASRGVSGVAQRIEARFLTTFNKGRYSPTDLADFLVSLYLLGAPETQQLCKEFLDTLVARRGRGRYFPSEVANKILSVLLNQGDYSRFPLLEVTIQESLNHSYPLDLDLILAYARKPELRDAVFNQVTSLASNSNASVRKEAIFLLSNLVDVPETHDVLRNKAMFDSSTDVRLRASGLLADIYQDAIAASVCKQVATSTADTASFVRAIIELNRFPSPTGLKSLKDVQAGISQGYFMDFVGLTISAYQPPRPPINTPVKYMVDSLRSFINEVSSFDWLGGDEFVNELDTDLLEGQSALSSGDSLECARKVHSVQGKLDLAYGDSLDSNHHNVTYEGWRYLHYYAQYVLDRLPQIPVFPGCVVKLVSNTGAYLVGGSLQYYDASWKDATNNNEGTFSITTGLKTVTLRMTYEGGSQTKSNVPVGPDTVVFQTVNTQVKLQNSAGILIDTGSVQYYAGSWRSFGTTSNGIASKELLPGTYSFRMSYAHGNTDKQQDIGVNPTVVFQTVNASVHLQNSQGIATDEGTVQYYSGGWWSFGITSNGIATKELLPNNYSFRMTYAFASNDKQQNVGTNPNVIFQTINTTVQLQNSQGNPIDQGTVQYYSGAWREFGTTSNGTAARELLPNNYSFRMTYAFASKDKQQNVGTNPAVVFQTVNAAVQLKNSLGNPLDQGTVQYYAGTWRSFGATINGTVSKELLPNNYPFRMKYEFVSNDKSQDIGANGTVSFSTVLCNIRVRNSQNQPANDAIASYYSGAWRTIGPTVNGDITKELLPANMTFRVRLGAVSQDKAQNIGTNGMVEFVVQ